jgi:hypothetical protein
MIHSQQNMKLLQQSLACLYKVFLCSYIKIFPHVKSKDNTSIQQLLWVPLQFNVHVLALQKPHSFSEHVYTSGLQPSQFAGTLSTQQLICAQGNPCCLLVTEKTSCTMSCFIAKAQFPHLILCSRAYIYRYDSKLCNKINKECTAI